MTCRISFSCLFFFYSFSFQSVWNNHWSIELFQNVWNNHWSIELSLPFSSWWFFQGKIQCCLTLTLDNTHGIPSSSFLSDALIPTLKASPLCTAPSWSLPFCTSLYCNATLELPATGMYRMYNILNMSYITQVPNVARWKSKAKTWVRALIRSPNLYMKIIIRQKTHLITICSFLYSLMKVCLILPVLLSISVHMASVVQIIHESFLPTLHQEVCLSFISPSSIRSFRSVSYLFREEDEMQHLKNPPFLVQSLANLDCSCNS